MNIFVNDSSFFAAPYLAEALECDLYVLNTKNNEFFGKGVPMGIYAGEKGQNVPNGDITIIGVYGLETILHRIERGDFDRVNFIVCDTDARLKYKWWNEQVRKYGIKLYAMHDLYPYCRNPSQVIYHYMRVDPALIEPKPDRILVTHSPSGPHKARVKGTDLIIRTVEKLQKTLDFDFQLITGMSQSDAIRAKSRSHIFIDQIIWGNKDIDQSRFDPDITYTGGIGKSGIEAMHCGVAVITSGTPDWMDYIITPPIIYTDAKNFEKDLSEMIRDQELHKQVRIQKKWIDSYDAPFVKDWLTV